VKATLVAAAAEEMLFPVDSVYNWLEDLEGLAADTERSKLLGFHARATINPRQLDVIHRIYRPAETDVRWAKALVDGLAEMDICGTPQHVVNGVITDPLAVHQARTILSYREV
jgi:citrate lyase subunit beta/citryl-CoA lyase